MNTPNPILEKAIDDAILEVERDYAAHEWRYLSENDVVCMIFSRLEGRLSNPSLFPSTEPRFYPHAEIRPYVENGDGTWVLRQEKNGDTSWVQKEEDDGEHSSGRIDLVVIEGDMGFDAARSRAITKQWKDDEHDDLKFARIVSYPLASFEAAIEVKVKVRKNKKKILKDLNKLDMIKEKHPRCIARMVILDHCALKNSPRNVADIEKKIENLNGRVKCFRRFT